MSATRAASSLPGGFWTASTSNVTAQVRADANASEIRAIANDMLEVADKREAMTQRRSAPAGGTPHDPR